MSNLVAPNIIRKYRILLVDDEEIVLAVFGSGLKNAGYEVDLESSAAGALERIADVRPDLAVIDNAMPGMSGLDLGQELTQRQVPFVFLSACSDPEVVREATELGALGYLVKPVDVGRAIPTIEAALRRAKDLYSLQASGDRLTHAIETGSVVNVAVGILMERHQITQQAAFDIVRHRARSERRKASDVAGEFLQAWHTSRSFEPLDS